MVQYDYLEAEQAEELKRQACCGIPVALQQGSERVETVSHSESIDPRTHRVIRRDRRVGEAPGHLERLLERRILRVRRKQAVQRLADPVLRRSPAFGVEVDAMPGGYVEMGGPGDDDDANDGCDDDISTNSLPLTFLAI